jgi:hypothetical protein
VADTQVHVTKAAAGAETKPLLGRHMARLLALGRAGHITSFIRILELSVWSTGLILLSSSKTSVSLLVILLTTCRPNNVTDVKIDHVVAVIYM